MKITIEQDFTNWPAHQVADWFRRFQTIYAGADVVVRDEVVVKSRDTDFVVPEPIRVDADGVAIDPVQQGMAQEPAQQTKKPRKPRNDAGKPRGPYKTNGGPAASTPADQADVAASSAAAPVSPTNAAAPAVANTDGVSPAKAESPNSGSGATPPAAAAPLTEADARAALKRINETPGLGMEAVMAHLRDFGTNRASLLKPEQYADFIASASEKIAAVKAAAERNAKVAK